MNFEVRAGMVAFEELKEGKLELCLFWLTVGSERLEVSTRRGTA